MDVPSQWLIPLAGASGVSFSLIGIAFRLGQPRGIHPVHIWLFGGLLGSAATAAMSLGTDWLGVPARVWLVGAAAGISQYAVLGIIRAALARGPLSPVWCAVMLSLIPAVLYSFAVAGERPNALHLGAIASAVGCIVAASAGHPADPSAPRLGRAREKVLYGLLLLGCVLVSGVAATAVKDLSSHGRPGEGDYMSRYRNVYLLLLYSFLALGSGVELAVRRRFGAPVGPAARLGVLAGTASVLGMVALCIAARAPAATVFTTNAVCSILSAAVVSVLAFREKLTAAWAATISLAALTIVLANLA